MNELSIPAAAVDKPEAALAGYVRMMSSPPGPARAVKIGNITYVSLEGRVIFVPPAHRDALLRAGWADAA